MHADISQGKFLLSTVHSSLQHRELTFLTILDAVISRMLAKQITNIIIYFYEKCAGTNVG